MQLNMKILIIMVLE